MECLDRLGYGAESCHTVVSSKLGFTMQRKLLSVNPAVNGYLLELGKDKAAKGEECLSSAVPKIQWDSNPTT